MIYLWHRRYRKILAAMQDHGQPMTIEMIMQASGYNGKRKEQKKKEHKALVLRFRDWALENEHITKQVVILAPGKTRITYSLTPQPSDSN